MKSLAEVVQDHWEKLTLYVPVVDRVHGGAHPEFHEVKRLFESLSDKIQAGQSDLDQEFTELREVTDNYTVPSDVCESYEAVYAMLADADKAYTR